MDKLLSAIWECVVDMVVISILMLLGMFLGVLLCGIFLKIIGVI